MVLLVGGCDRQKPPEQQGAPTAAVQSSRPGIDRSRAGSTMPNIEVRNPDGEMVPLTSLQEAGKPLLINLWATWCAPCIKELPTLERLADRSDAPVVVALSQDSGDQSKVSAFLAEKKLGLEPDRRAHV